MGKSKEKTVETMSRDVASHGVGNTRLQHHPCTDQVQYVATCLYYLSMQLHLEVLSIMDLSIIE